MEDVSRPLSYRRQGVGPLAARYYPILYRADSRLVPVGEMLRAQGTYLSVTFQSFEFCVITPAEIVDRETDISLRRGG